MNDQKFEDFGGDEELAAEYSDEKTCPLSDSGYHCSCYDWDLGVKECCICEQRPEPKTENFYRGPVKAPIDFSKHLVIEKPKEAKLKQLKQFLTTPLDPEGKRGFGLHTQGVCSECGWDSHGIYRGESNRACWKLRAETHLSKFPNCSLAQKCVAQY